MRKALTALLLLTLAVTGLVWFWGRANDGPIPEDELPPMGVWFGGNPVTRAVTQDPDELARLLALPYAAGEKLATVPGLGVVTHDRERAQPGVNFYVSGHASEAILMDMDGTFLHRWQADQFELFPDLEVTSASQPYNLRRAHLLPNGDILALWHGGGLARIDLRSNVVWKQDLGFYNDLYYAPPDVGEGLDPSRRRASRAASAAVQSATTGGRKVLPYSNPRPTPTTTTPADPHHHTTTPLHHHTITPTLIALHKTAETRPRFGPDPILNDQLLWLDAATGEPLRRLSLLDAVLDSEWAPLLDQEHRDPADLLHANTITILDEATVAGSPFEPGWILVSLREISLVAVLDPEANNGHGKIAWGLHGPFHRQHEPVLLPGDGDNPATLLVFDNAGGPDRSTRVLHLSLDGEILWRYPDPQGRTADRRLDSTQGAGAVHPLANGNLLVVDSVSGRALELAPDANGGWHDIVWQFETPHRAGKHGTLIATLMDLERHPRPEWLP